MAHNLYCFQVFNSGTPVGDSGALVVIIATVCVRFLLHSRCYCNSHNCWAYAGAKSKTVITVFGTDAAICLSSFSKTVKSHCLA